jgi:hypothetical protein
LLGRLAGLAIRQRVVDADVVSGFGRGGANARELFGLSEPDGRLLFERLGLHVQDHHDFQRAAIRFTQARL